MSLLPSVTTRELLAALLRAGFPVVRSKGTHHYLQHRNDPGCRMVIAIHPGDLPSGAMQAILKQACISRRDFLRLH